MRSPAPKQTRSRSKVTPCTASTPGNGPYSRMIRADCVFIADSSRACTQPGCPAASRRVTSPSGNRGIIQRRARPPPTACARPSGASASSARCSDFNADVNAWFSEAQQRAGTDYNGRREPPMSAAGRDAGPLARIAAMTGTDVATYTRDRSGLSAFALEDGVVCHARPMRAGWTACGARTSGSTARRKGATRAVSGGGIATPTTRRPARTPPRRCPCQAAGRSRRWGVLRVRRMDRRGLRVSSASGSR